MESVSELDGIGGTIENEKYGSQVEAKNALKALVESCRWRFEEAICETWSKGKVKYLSLHISLLIRWPVADARAFFHLENWAINALERTTTTYLDRIAALQRHNATVAWQVAGGSIEPGASKVRLSLAYIRLQCPDTLLALRRLFPKHSSPRSRTHSSTRCTISWMAWYTSLSRRSHRCWKTKRA